MRFAGRGGNVLIDTQSFDDGSIHQGFSWYSADFRTAVAPLT